MNAKQKILFGFIDKTKRENLYEEQEIVFCLTSEQYFSSTGFLWDGSIENDELSDDIDNVDICEIMESYFSTESMSRQDIVVFFAKLNTTAKTYVLEWNQVFEDFINQ